MKRIAQHQVDAAFKSKNVCAVTVLRRSLKCWYFTFKCASPQSGEMQTYTLETQRGKIRTWSDPRNLFAYLSERLNVKVGDFKLLEEIDEKDDSAEFEE